jgi:cytochrome c
MRSGKIDNRLLPIGAFEVIIATTATRVTRPERPEGSQQTKLQKTLPRILFRFPLNSEMARPSARVVRHLTGPSRRIRASLSAPAWTVAAALAMALTLSACGGSDEGNGSEATSTAVSDAAASNASAPAESTPASTPPDPAPARAGAPAAAPAAPPPSAPAALDAAAAPAEEATPPAEEAGPASAAASPSAPAAEAVVAASSPPPAESAAASGGEAAAVSELSVLTAEPPPLSAEMAAMIENGDADAGRSYAQRCVGCHSFLEEQTEGGPEVGPALFGIFEADAGAQPGFDYSPALKVMHDAGLTWTAARLNALLTDPAVAAPGTIMNYRGISDDQDRANVIAYLRSLVPEPQVGGIDPELLRRITAANIANGEALATGRCGTCHRFTAEGDPLVGPNLYNIFGAPVAAAEGFGYSQAFLELKAEDATWTAGRLDEFLANPAIAVPGTRMGFAGIADPDDRAAVIAYLRTLADTEAPLVTQELLGIGTQVGDLTPLTFTSSQRSSGALWYARLGCDRCHGSNLQGLASNSVEHLGPALVGTAFAEKWFGGDVYELYAFITGHSADVVQDDDQIALLTAFILEANGFVPGTVELPQDHDLLREMGFYQ